VFIYFFGPVIIMDVSYTIRVVFRGFVYNLLFALYIYCARDSSVGIATAYDMDGWGSVPGRVQTGSGARQGLFPRR
jgi:hypothetical protein